MTPQTVILADGSFPEHPVPLMHLKKAERIICCDGSARSLHEAGMEPEAIVGDLDSIDPMIAGLYSDRLFRDSEQETNDLTKTVRWCINNRYDNIVIVGATGKREDHTVGNISLLAEYAREVTVVMVTDTGTFTPLLKTGIIKTFPGQQISVFSVDPGTEISTAGLKYELSGLRLGNWWRGTLNEAIGDSVEIRFDGGPVMVYQKFEE